MERIPDKGRDYVLKHAERIAPICLNHDDEDKPYFGTTTCNPFNQSFPWDFKPTTAAIGLVEIGRIQTLHTWAYYGFFKPTVAEVINQIPEDQIDQVDCFLVNGPETADDLNKHRDLLNEGYHVAETILYRQSRS